MSEKFDEIMNKMTELLKSEAKTENIIGQPFPLGEYTCVPVMRVGLGFGGGEGGGENSAAGAGKGSGSGIGGGIGLEPMGFLVSKGDHIHFVTTKAPGVLNQALEQLPSLLQKFLDNRK